MIGSEQYANAALDACYGDRHSTDWPDTFQVCGFIGDPTLGGVQPSAGGYAPIVIDNDSVNWPDAVGRVKSSGPDFVFPESTGDWGGVVDFWALLDPDDVVCDYGPLTMPVDISEAGQDARFIAGSIAISM